jgi:hypothetical protein
VTTGAVTGARPIELIGGFETTYFPSHDRDVAETTSVWFACGPGTGHWGDANLGSNLPHFFFGGFRMRKVERNGNGR